MIASAPVNQAGVSACPPLVLMMAGGTGGHVYPALAVAQELQARGLRVAWVGTARGLEARVVPAAGITLHELPVRGVRGKNVTQTLAGVWYLMQASIQALRLVQRLQPACVIGMGGYAAGPAGLAAWLLRKPLLIHEQNAVAGTTNRLLAPLASQVVAGFAGAFKDSQQVTVLGNPVRSPLLAAARAQPWNFDGKRPLRVLVVGGSLGARPINEVVIAAMKLMHEELSAGQLELWHQSGDANATDVTGAYGDLLQPGLRVSPFIEDMAAAYGWADLVLCRAGALTVAELAIMGRPALLVPLPQAIDDHQTANAHALSDVGGGRLIPQAEFTPEALVKHLRSYLAHPQILANMAAATHAAARPDATRQLADACQELLRDE